MRVRVRVCVYACVCWCECATLKKKQQCVLALCGLLRSCAHQSTFLTNTRSAHTHSHAITRTLSHSCTRIHVKSFYENWKKKSLRVAKWSFWNYSKIVLFICHFKHVWNNFPQKNHNFFNEYFIIRQCQRICYFWKLQTDKFGLFNFLGVCKREEPLTYNALSLLLTLQLPFLKCNSWCLQQ